MTQPTIVGARWTLVGCARVLVGSVMLVTAACGPALTPSAAPPSLSPGATAAASTPSRSIRHEGRGDVPYTTGTPIGLDNLTGTILFDDFENLYSMAADGSDVRGLTRGDGPEFDGAWSPDGQSIAYRDSRRGMNVDDEIYVAAADGSNARNLTDDPANDWGPDWSPDGQWVVFNSDRDGGVLAAFVVRPDGSGLRKLPIDGWVEYPSFSPDGTRIAYMGHAEADYDIFVAEIATGRSVRLTTAPGSDGWPVWSPDGSLIAFSSERDDCSRAAADQDCWRTGEPGDHRDPWVMSSDGSNQRRITPEHGQFLAWSPDGRYLLASGQGLYAVRLDGTGRTAIRPDNGVFGGGIPDWIERK